jgi:hypothetical protein
MRFGALLIVVRRYEDDAHVRAYLASMLWVAMKPPRGVPAFRRECLLLGRIGCDAASGAWRRQASVATVLRTAGDLDPECAWLTAWLLF